MQASTRPQRRLRSVSTQSSRGADGAEERKGGNVGIKRRFGRGRLPERSEARRERTKHVRPFIASEPRTRAAEHSANIAEMSWPLSASTGDGGRVCRQKQEGLEMRTQEAGASRRAGDRRDRAGGGRWGEKEKTGQFGRGHCQSALPAPDRSEAGRRTPGYQVKLRTLADDQKLGA
ncbi:hypothetical protein THAOC_12536 [Thalassiosira oceanica]|uniref:Uncharacterized protein n=1 Tax=Thalassiosira oceanica TaxID=159749 RepID=K0T7V0_THAOC|nr:hypothetical protein THAOC_12536 [Thalassiosira oceanica]|eukprot:EJK66542.1 hypothetical protein THAOC_12536 [Thalassiosira oceanica]